MKARNLIHAGSIFSMALALFLIQLSVAGFAQMTLEKTAEGTWVKENGKNVLFYQTAAKSLDGKYSRANYIHPLHGIDGSVLTEDFPADHLHHRGVFWTWHRVIIGDKQIGDAWECRDFIWDVQQTDYDESTNQTAIINARILWKSPAWTDDRGNLKPFVEEKLTITVNARTANYRVIDFDITLLALEENLSLAGSDDEKGYSGFSVRMKMPADISFASSNGAVIPALNQVVAGPWMDISGSLDKEGKKEGILIVQHNDNPHYPQPWILRKSGSMQNPVYPGRQLVRLDIGSPTVLRYRLVVYKQGLSGEEMEKVLDIQ